MKKNTIRVGLLISGITLFCWALINAANGTAYAIETGDALGGALQVGVSIPFIIVFMYIVKKVTDRIETL